MTTFGAFILSNGGVTVVNQNSGTPTPSWKLCESVNLLVGHHLVGRLNVETSDLLFPVF